MSRWPVLELLERNRWRPDWSRLPAALILLGLMSLRGPELLPLALKLVGGAVLVVLLLVLNLATIRRLLVALGARWGSVSLVVDDAVMLEWRVGKLAMWQRRYDSPRVESESRSPWLAFRHADGVARIRLASDVDWSSACTAIGADHSSRCRTARPA